MSRKKNNTKAPRKLKEFLKKTHLMDQHDTESATSSLLLRQEQSLNNTPENMDCTAPKDRNNRDNSKRAASSPFASPTHSAAVIKKHQKDTFEGETSGEEQTETLASLSTSDNPASENMMKHMLLSLQRDLKKDFNKSMALMQRQIDHLGDRTDTVETKLTEYSSAYNELVDAHQAQTEEMERMSAKLADLEDRSRRNNIKVRGIPENILPSELTPFLQRLFTTLVPAFSPLELTIDRAHRLHKPLHIPADKPRDVLLRLHFFQTKERILQATKNVSSLPDPYANLSLYSDISPATAQRRREFAPITIALRERNIPYTWGFPFKLFVTYQGKSSVIYQLQHGLKQLHNWGIPPAQVTSQPRNSAPLRVQEPWKQVNSTSST